jgi:hypothetical protein
VYVGNLQKIDVNGKDALYAPDYVLLGLQCAAELLQLVENEDNLGIFAANFTNQLDAVLKNRSALPLSSLSLLAKNPCSCRRKLVADFNSNFRSSPVLTLPNSSLPGVS